MTQPGLTEDDYAELDRRGIARDEADRQLELLRHPPPCSQLDRACTVGDGLVRLDADEKLSCLDAWRTASASGRLTKFVPASGAASRMFKELAALHDLSPTPSLDTLRRAAERGDALAGIAAVAVPFFEQIEDFAFRDLLVAELRRDGADLPEQLARGALREILDALLHPDRIGLAARPKGLLPFHGQGAAARTPFEEHLVEAAHYVRDDDRLCRIHFTISAEHEPQFKARYESVRAAYEQRLDVRFDVSFSRQSPSTDTIALTPSGAPFRDGAGRLVLRPGGHGALIRNLAELEGDVVLIKNIDNVVPDARKGPTLEWKRVLAGLAVRLQARISDFLDRLAADDSAALSRGLALAREELSAEPPPRIRSAGAAAERDWLRTRLDRPLRVCGVVKNEGEPGGGPFWVRDEDGGSSLQIVESARVDHGAADQAAVWNASTHFNPVDITAVLRDRKGRPYRLDEFVDWGRVFITTKSTGGRELKSLERPGLWNGAMAHWNSVFVEVPLETFAPVKKITDLLGPAHR